MAASAPGGRLAALLVDDERDFVETLGARLQARGIDARVVFGGEAALAALQRDAPPVMVLDLKMPGTDGLAVLRRLREPGRPPVAVIVLTGHGSDAELAEARSLGAWDCVRKPVDIERLKRMILRAGGAIDGAREEGD